MCSVVSSSSQFNRFQGTEAVTGGVLWKKLFLEISQNSQENTCARVSFLVKLQAWGRQPYQKRHWHRCFPVNFAKFPRAPFLQNTSKRLLLRPLIYFCTSWKQQQTTGFQVFFKWYDGAARIEWVTALTSSCFKVFQYLCKIRSSYERFSVKKYVLKNFAKCTEKHLSPRIKSLRHRRFPASIAKCSRTPFWRNTSRRLLL